MVISAVNSRRCCQDGPKASGQKRWCKWAFRWDQVKDAMRKRWIVLSMTKRGALVGCGVGAIVLAGVLVAAVRCLPFRIAAPPPPWPWYCSDPAYSAILYLAFPVNLLTNDLAQAILLFPLSLLLYALLGALIGFRLDRPAG